MPNILGKLFSVILLVVAVFFVPVYQNYKQQDNLAYQVAYQAVTDFVDNVRTKGYITPKMVEDFESRIEIGTYLYKTDFLHQKKVYTPVYSDPANPSSFTGEYTVDFDEYYNAQMLPILFDESNTVPKEDRRYYLSAGDFFSVTIENITRTRSSMLFDFLTGGGGDGVEIVIPYGGMVLNEDY